MNTIVSVADDERAQILVGAAAGNSAASAAAGPTTLWTVAGIVSDARRMRLHGAMLVLGRLARAAIAIPAIHKTLMYN